MDGIITAAAGEGRFRVAVCAVPCGADWSVTVCGGELHHVGAAALAQYEPERGSATVSTITAFTHRDDAVAARFAKEIARARRCTVSVSAGIHVDGAGPAELRALQDSAAECLRALLVKMEGKT